MELYRKLSSALEDQGDGYYGGHVTIPETTTFTFCGDDAERMFAVIEPLLRENPICAGRHNHFAAGRTPSRGLAARPGAEARARE